MGLLDDYQNISGLLNQELVNYYNQYQDWGQKNRQQMEGTVLDPMMKMSDTVLEALQTPGSEVMMPQVGLTLKQLQGAPKEAFRRLILGPGRPGRDVNFIDNFKSFKDYVRQHGYIRSQLPTGNKQTVDGLLTAANKIIESNKQVGDLVRYGDEGFENLIRGSNLVSKPTTLRTSVVNQMRPNLAGMADKDKNIVELAMGTKNINLPNTLPHEMVHIRSKELDDYLRRLYDMEDKLINHVERTNPRGSSLHPDRLGYFAEPEEVMARGVASEVSNRMGLKYPDVKDSWYRHQSWPEELNPMWSEIADKLMSR